MTLLSSSPVNSDEDMRQYLDDIQQFPLLTIEQEQELARRCSQGDRDAICRMVNSNLRLVVSVARDYANRGAPLLDLIQEGSIGLLTAVEKFDYTRETRLSTYATKWIRQRITRYLADCTSLIRVPQHTADLIRKVQTAQKTLFQETGREPTIAQIAERCELPEDRVYKYLGSVKEVCSIDVPTTDEDAALVTILEDTDAPRPQEELIREELNRIMKDLLSVLTERQQQVLCLHFGIPNGDSHSLEDIGKILGISKERVRQIEHQAMEKLQKMGTSMGLEDFLE